MADNTRAVGSVTYREAEHGYFEKRQLRRHAAFWSLWALGVGAVISGDFYGWNLGLDAGGFGGLLIAAVVITIMYYGLCFSIAEMSPALPHTGGAYSFSRSAMGPWGGFITGLAENMEYVITPAVVVGAMGFLSHDIVYDLTGTTGWWNSPVLWWAVYYIIFVGINILGIEITMRFTVAITVAALAVLVFFFLSVLFSGKFDASLLTNIPPEEGGNSFLPKGIAGIFPALPFAIWFYLAIEELPLAAEESHDPKRDIPRATIWGLTTLMFLGVGILFLNTGVGGGAAEIGTSATPFFDGFKAVFGEGVGSSLLGILALIGLIASFFTIIYAYGRNTYSLSRAGYFPQVLSLTHGTRHTPYVALIAGAVIGYILSLVIYFLGQSESAVAGKIVGALLYMAVFGAVISYFMQSLAFIVLRRRLPHIERPYRSPVGQWGAAIAGAIALVALVSLFLNEDYRPGVYGTAVYFVIGLIYFAVRGRHKLVLSPEEEFAMSHGRHGANLQEEGYGTVSVADIAAEEEAASRSSDDESSSRR
ncbi:amino acid ABC transporter permease [Mycolicibacterium agri]|uniref:Amino acid ABC transporter permease n=1 Tax=Mycolicibacterium agri TaxID=36811 RepID=A0A2A7MSX2_MYCAG|nr:amino acid permease [Mycolicibacterium agri]PEG34248.1 amino acid ABC transporter permease [Mycolicibacterium agri]GFG49705.1 amino acid ABC transporter permease [Mycolicibacterium agri]